MRFPVHTAWFGRLVLALLIAVALGWGPYHLYRRSGLAKLLKLRRELAALRMESQELRRSNARLRAEVALHEEDARAAIERAAREELGLVRPGEIVFRVEGASGALGEQQGGTTR